MIEGYIEDRHLKTAAAREEYAKRIGAADTIYLETLAYVRADPKLTDDERIDLLELPWDRFAGDKSLQAVLPTSGD